MTTLLRTTKHDLAPHIKAVANVAPSKTTLPILTHIHMRRSGGFIDFTASDTAMQITSTMESDGPDFALCLPAAKLAQIINALPNEASIVLEQKEHAVLLKAGRSKFNIPALAADEYPMLKADKAEQVQIDQKVLSVLIERVRHAMAKQDVRMYLNGVNFEMDGSKITTVGTDGHRLAIASTYTECGTSTCILPSAAIAELSKLLNGGNVLVAIGTATASFDFGQIHLITKVIDGKFPDYNRVIPTTSPHAATIDKQDLLSALAQVSVFANEKYQGVRAKFSDAKLALHCENQDGGESSNEIDIGYAGPAIEIGLNVKYLTDAVSAFDGDEVVIHLEDANRSLLIDDGATKDLRCVVMPMRL